MKLLLIIISTEDSTKVINSLLKEKFMVTKLATTGGLLLNGNTTLLCGTDDDRVTEAVTKIGELCKSRKQPMPTELTNQFGMLSSMPADIQVGGATIFVLDVNSFYKV